MASYGRKINWKIIVKNMETNQQEKNEKMIDTVQKLYDKLMEQYVIYCRDTNGYDIDAQIENQYDLQNRMDFNTLVTEVASNIEKKTTEESFCGRLTWDDIVAWMEFEKKFDFHCFVTFKRLLLLRKEPNGVMPGVVGIVDFNNLAKMSVENQEEQLEILQMLNPQCSKLLENFHMAIICKLLLNGGLDLGLKRAIYFRYGILEKYKAFDLENIEDEPEMVCAELEKRIKIS